MRRCCLAGGVDVIRQSQPSGETCPGLGSDTAFLVASDVSQRQSALCRPIEIGEPVFSRQISHDTHFTFVAQDIGIARECGDRALREVR